MGLVIADRVKETSTTTGTGAFTLAGAMTGFRAFSSVCSTNDTCYYCIQAVDSSGLPTGEWEVGLGTYSGANTLTRTTVSASSNSNAAVSFAAGTKQVWIDLTAADYITTRNNAATYRQVATGSGTISSSSAVTITGLDTANYDYRVSFRLNRGSGGSSSDYLTMQFGDSTPTWDTSGLFMSVTGANTGGLTTSSGVTRICQVQNNSTLDMGATADISFANGSRYILDALVKSYMWENSVVLDGTLSARCASLKFLTVNQTWNYEYTVWALKRT